MGSILNKRAACMSVVMVALLTAATGVNAVTNHYLFVGHPRDDGPGEIVQRDVERIDFSRYDLLMLGGDYAWHGTGTRETVAYLDAIFDLSSPATLAALGNHDTANRSYFTDVTGRATSYAVQTNGITVVVLDTTDDGQDIMDDELQMLENAVHALSNSTHLVIVHHHIIWMADYPPLAHLKGSPLVGASSANLSGLNFYEDVYPLLVQARSNGVAVTCLAGDRTGTETEEFFIDHTTTEGVRFIAAGLKEELTPTLRTVVVMEHDTETGTITYAFKHLSDLPRIPDEPLVINELHYDPTPDNEISFVELLNRGEAPYDLSGATFSSGVGFTFPTNTLVAPGEYLLVAATASRYAGLGVRVFDYEGNTKPDSNDPMWLRGSDGREIDYVPYGVSDPWPPEPDNTGPSLALIAPRLDNTPSTSWAVSDQRDGTPGAANFPPPSSKSMQFLNGATTMRWQGTVNGARYRLDWTPTLTPPHWRPHGTGTVAGSAELVLTDTNTPPRRFYRMSREFR